MANKIYEVLYYPTVDKVAVWRENNIHIYPVTNSTRYLRVQRLQMRMIDPRTSEQIARDEHDSEVIETQNDARPY